MNAAELAHEFTTDHARLIPFGLKVHISGRPIEVITEGDLSITVGSTEGPEEEVTPKTHSITAMRPFLFDRRWLPKSYKGYEVLDVVLSGYHDGTSQIDIPLPHEFDLQATDEPMSWADAVGPERYEAFVDRCGDVIRMVLHQPDMSRKDMLDALAGDFDDHVERCRQARIDWLLR